MISVPSTAFTDTAITRNEPPSPPMSLSSSLEMRSSIGVPAAITVSPSTTTSFQT
ncbi:MAG TPA: hypothetical protein VF322_06330 [Gammaproteobacteria bacterium]